MSARGTGPIGRSRAAFLRRLYLAVFLTFGLAVVLWGLAWVMR